MEETTFTSDCTTIVQIINQLGELSEVIENQSENNIGDMSFTLVVIYVIFAFYSWIKIKCERSKFFNNSLAGKKNFAIENDSQCNEISAAPSSMQIFNDSRLNSFATIQTFATILQKICSLIEFVCKFNLITFLIIIIMDFSIQFLRNDQIETKCNCSYQYEDGIGQNRFQSIASNAVHM